MSRTRAYAGSSAIGRERPARPCGRTVAWLVLAAVVVAIAGGPIPRIILASMRGLEPGTTAVTLRASAPIVLFDAPAFARGSAPLTDYVTEVAPDALDGEAPLGQSVSLSETRRRAEGLVRATLDLGILRIDDELVLDTGSAFPHPDADSRLRAAPTRPAASDGVGVSDEGAPASQAGPFARLGLQYRFPAPAEAKSYPVFDPVSLVSSAADFVDEVPLPARPEGSSATAFRYLQRIGPIALGEEAGQAARWDTPLFPALTAPAWRFGERDGGADAQDTDGTDSPGRAHAGPSGAPRGDTAGARTDLLTVPPTYQLERWITVEPSSGRIIDERVTRTVSYAGTPVWRLATSWDKASVAGQVSEAMRVIRVGGVLAAWSWTANALIIGLLAATVAVIVRWRRGHGARP